MTPLAYDLPTAAALINMSTWSLRRWIRLGKLVPSRLSAKLLIPHDELVRVLKQGQQEQGKAEIASTVNAEQNV